MKNFATAPFVIAVLALAGYAPASAQDMPAPALSSAPIVTDASGHGLIPTVSGHTAILPTLYQLDAQPIEQISPLVQRQYLSGTQSTFVKWTVKKGGKFPLHHHANEQITWITEGRCEVYSQGKKFVMTAGTVLVIPPNAPHEFICTEDTIDIDFFAPQRQDWLDGAPSVAAGK
jgi:quercetin dioxygenase-like cupin family protein